MSTKMTITHGGSYHVYQEMCVTDKVYVRVDKDSSEVRIDDHTQTLIISPELMDEIAKGWLENRGKFDEEECSFT